MRDFAIKQPANESLAKNHSHTKFAPTPRVKNISVGRNSHTLLQRRASCACGGDCPRCKDQTVIQPKLSTLADGYEKEGNRAEVSSNMQGKIDAMRAGGEPLAESARIFFESRFSQDFSRVRVHTDATAAESARGLNAMAYTVGNDIIFGTGKYSPQTQDGKRLLAHELAHVVQQRSGAGPILQRKTFKETWDEFTQLRYSERTAEALSLVPTLLAELIGEDGITYGSDLLQWLIKQGEWQLAREALRSVEDAWWIRFVDEYGVGVPKVMETRLKIPSGPEELIGLAEQQAAADKHDQARELFGTAFLFLQMQLVMHSKKRLKELEDINKLEQDQRFASGSGFMSILRYFDPEYIFAYMRRILSFYPAQQRQALAKGDMAKAEQLADLNTKLLQYIREHGYLLTGEADALPGITLEGTLREDKKRGYGYTLHGMKFQEEFVTPLAGEPRSDKLAHYSAYYYSMEELFEILTGQEEFLTEIFSQPEVRKEFRNRPPGVNDMSSMKTRLRVWRAMFKQYQKQPGAGCDTPLCSLLRLVEHYLRHFTLHTESNIDDFGVSYLDREMPVDLAARALRDCGVYAITTAYEVYHTINSVSPRLEAGFQLYHTLEHVMLVITDKSSNTHYVVNNDRIIGPRSGDASGTVANAYSDILQHKHVLSMAGLTPELSSKLSDAAFRKRLWKSFQSGARLEIEIEPSKGPDDKRDIKERTEDTMKHYYETLTLFDRLGGDLHIKLDRLELQLASAAQTDYGRIVAEALPELTEDGAKMAKILDAFAWNKINVGLEKPPPVEVKQRVLITAGREGDHPLVRISMVLMLAEKLGYKLNTVQQQLLDTVRNIPGASFVSRLTEYDQAGRPPKF